MAQDHAQVDPVFSIEGLWVYYGFRCAVSDLSLTLNRGESLGILGINGAGKTSTLRVLLGMLRPRKGKVRLFNGRPGTVSKYRLLGFAPEDGVPPEYLSAQEYLSFVGAFRISERRERDRQIGELLDWFELQGQKKIRDYSKGMKRRIVLAQAFLGNPPLLVLDEPLNGLDPLMIIKLRDRLELYRQTGGSLLFSSHILSEVEKTCSRVAILDQGHLKYAASLEVLTQEFGSIEKAFTAKVGSS